MRHHTLCVVAIAGIALTGVALVHNVVLSLFGPVIALVVAFLFGLLLFLLAIVLYPWLSQVWRRRP
jgi:hypothetical protein